MPIPGTTKIDRMKENAGAAAIELTAGDLEEINTAVSKLKSQGERYPEHLQRRIDR